MSYLFLVPVSKTIQHNHYLCSVYIAVGVIGNLGEVLKYMDGACTLAEFSIHCNLEPSSEDRERQLYREEARFQLCYKWPKTKYYNCLIEDRSLFSLL